LAGEPEAPFQAPPPFAIANTLLRAWANVLSSPGFPGEGDHAKHGGGDL
jgi:hypothetical protein